MTPDDFMCALLDGSASYTCPHTVVRALPLLPKDPALKRPLVAVLEKFVVDVDGWLNVISTGNDASRHTLVAFADIVSNIGIVSTTAIDRLDRAAAKTLIRAMHLAPSSAVVGEMMKRVSRRGGCAREVLAQNCRIEDMRLVDDPALAKEVLRQWAPRFSRTQLRGPRSALQCLLNTPAVTRYLSVNIWTDPMLREHPTLCIFLADVLPTMHLLDRWVLNTANSSIALAVARKLYTQDISSADSAILYQGIRSRLDQNDEERQRCAMFVAKALAAVTPSMSVFDDLSYEATDLGRAFALAHTAWENEEDAQETPAIVPSPVQEGKSKKSSCAHALSTSGEESADSDDDSAWSVDEAPLAPLDIKQADDGGQPRGATRRRFFAECAEDLETVAKKKDLTSEEADALVCQALIDIPTAIGLHVPKLTSLLVTLSSKISAPLHLDLDKLVMDAIVAVGDYGMLLRLWRHHNIAEQELILDALRQIARKLSGRSDLPAHSTTTATTTTITSTIRNTFSLHTFFLPLWRVAPCGTVSHATPSLTTHIIITNDTSNRPRSRDAHPHMLSSWAYTLGVFVECAQGEILGHDGVQCASKAFRVCEVLRAHENEFVRRSSMFVLSRLILLVHANVAVEEDVCAEWLWVSEWLHDTVLRDPDEVVRKMALGMLPEVKKLSSSIPVP
eukprot:GEMP01009603.1.p1 GENE.GEMP01009603.1~~GEMP01009603.1.p1  ORF type:complete len:676 (+),score=177.84 GEMP01009603.1:67-2094(+)